MVAAPLHAPRRRQYRDDFPIFRHSVYLNSCSLGALSRRSRERVTDYLDLWERHGAAAWYEIWWSALADLRGGYARMVGARAADVALHPNISSTLTAVAESLDYRLRPRVVVTSLDFPTISYQWLAKRSEGVDVVVVESPDGNEVPLDAIERAVDGRTALVATSHVFFTSGAVQDVAALARIAHRRGALLLVDGYQAVGQVPVDVAAAGVDFYCAGGLKWLLGGSGIAFLYVRPDLVQEFAPRAAGWFGDRDQFRFDSRALHPHDDARRFEAGTPAVASVYAQLGGLEVLEDAGPDEVRRITGELTDDLVEQARAAGLAPKVAASAAARSAIVMLPRVDPAADVRRLAEAGIVADARPRHVRVSPYFYNVRDDHLALLELLTS
ncbi:MAG TPA: aminotransferase class V-fold PLP-dependent enzyme [Gemmatimonadales bacterium]|nr:aminotransferase class V-fold PLP-dependent enzyme [Gemmatimonadales bacterium]